MVEEMVSLPKYKMHWWVKLTVSSNKFKVGVMNWIQGFKRRQRPFSHGSPLYFQNEAQLGGRSGDLSGAYLRLIAMDFRIDWKTVECPTLTRRPPPVRTRDRAVRWHPCRWRGALAWWLLGNVSATPAQPSLVLELQWRLVWKRRIPVESHWFTRYCTQPLCGQAKCKDRQTGQPKKKDTSDYTKQSGQEGSRWRNSFYIYEFQGENYTKFDRFKFEWPSPGSKFKTVYPPSDSN